MTFADKLSARIEDAVNEGNGRNAVAALAVYKMADALAYNVRKPFLNQGESFVEIRFPADDSAIVISED